MTVAVANTELINSLNYLRNRVNELADAMSTVVLTVDTGVIAGNLQTSGSIEANAVYVQTVLRGGNTGTANVLYLGSNVVVNSQLLTVNAIQIGVTASNAYVNSSSFRMGANTTLTYTGVSVGNSTVNSFMTANYLNVGNSTANAVVNTSGFFLNGELFSSQQPVLTTTTGTSAQAIDEFDYGVYRTADYTISIKDNDANRFQAAKLLVTHDASAAHITEYGVISTDSPLGTFSADISGSNCRVLFTPLVSNTTVTGVRTSLNV